MLVRPGELEAGRLVDVRLRYLPTSKRALKRRARLLVHAGTAQTLATLSLLDSRRARSRAAVALAQLSLDEPMVLLPGDRFILRGFRAAARSRHHRRRRRRAAHARRATAARQRPRRSRRCASSERALAAGDVDALVRLEVARAGEAGITRAALQMRLPQPPRAVDAALARLSGARALRALRQGARRRRRRGGAGAARSSALSPPSRRSTPPSRSLGGMPREELRAKVSSDGKLLHLVVESLAGDGALVAERDTRAPAVARSDAAKGAGGPGAARRAHARALSGRRAAAAASRRGGGRARRRPARAWPRRRPAGARRLAGAHEGSRLPRARRRRRCAAGWSPT